MVNRHPSQSGIVWTRVLVEGIVIVGSILLALAVDEWWEGRELRKAEREILVRLTEEFDANATQFQVKAGVHQRLLTSGEALLEIMGSPARGQVSVDSLSTLMWDLCASATYDPEDGVLNSLITSGQMGVITNDDLRTALAGWPSLVKDLKEDEDRSWDYLDQFILPFVDKNVSFRTLHLSKRPTEFKRPSDFPDDLDVLLRSREFENYVAERYVRVQSGVMPALRAVEAGLGLIQALLREETRR